MGHKQRANKSMEAGKCRRHKDRDAISGKTMCQECLNTRKYTSKQHRKKCKAAGKCYSHPDRDAAPGKIRCQECMNYAKQCAKKLVEAGKCVHHSDRDAVPGRQSCQECLNNGNERSTNIYVPRRRAREALAPNEAVDRREVFTRDENKCQHCGKTCNGDAHAHADHIVPLSVGGPHCYWNFQTLCALCNKSKLADIRKEPKLSHLVHLPARKLIEAFAREQGATLPHGWWELRQLPRNERHGPK
jgi:5-methylcytosine-specific restriction endonuclease McrA